MSWERLPGDFTELGFGLLRNVVSGQALLPRNTFGSAIHVAQVSALSVSECFGGSPQWRELSNKLTCFRLFAYADAPGQRDAFSKVWVTEGRGYALAQAGIWPQAGHSLRPPEERIPIHTGAGLSLAERAMHSPEPLPSRLGSLIARSAVVAEAGHADVVVEALGLVVVTMHGEVLLEVDQALVDLHPKFRELFWHGVGRGLYFLPLHLAPLEFARRRPMELIQTLPPDEAGRENALAGLAWAMVLVNLRDPDVVEGWIAQLGPAVVLSNAFMNGITSALAVWRSAEPTGEAIASLEHFRTELDLWTPTIGHAIVASRLLKGREASVFRIAQVG